MRRSLASLPAPLRICTSAFADACLKSELQSQVQVRPCVELARHVQALRDNVSDVAVLENEPSMLPRSPHRDVHHGSGQVVGANDLVRE
jgi:hypothetical protein